MIVRAFRQSFLGFAALLVQLICAAPASYAVQPDEMLADPVLEARARALSRELRCMVCQNQSIDDSDAPLARDLRVLVRERLAAGDTDAQVIDFLVARYGPFVLLKPPLNRHTVLLWAGAPLALIGGALVVVVWARRRRPASALLGAVEPELTPDEKARLAEILDGRPPA